MLGLGVYLVLALVVGVQYALKPYYEGYKMVQQTLGSLSDADQRFLAELMRELDEERRNPGSAGAGGYASGGAGSAGGLAGGSADGSPDGTAAGLDPGQYLPGAYDANGLPITGNYGNGAAGLHDFLNDPEIKALTRKISLNDQMRALEIVRPSLSDEDIRQLVEWVKDGITPSEKVEIKKLLKARLNAEQIAQLRVLYDKYYGQV
jgi:hypothetical protein